VLGWLLSTPRLDESPHRLCPGSGGPTCGALWLHRWRAFTEYALRYTEAVVSYCESLRTFPYRGGQREDIRPGLRITHYKKRTVIAFAADAELVAFIGVFSGGQG